MIALEFAKQRILLVDDSKLNNQIMQDILSNDYDMFVSTSGEEALAIAASESIDLILLDVEMPEMDGYEVCRRLKKNPYTKNIPVIFVSAANDVQHETEGLEMGAIDYIIKPSNPAIIKARVKNHLELKTYRDILERISLIDGLIGIANRRHFDQTLEKEWIRALRKGDIISLALVDIDYFKKYNDYYGHLAGDKCLQKVGSILKESLYRTNDLVARYGGEEFVALLPATTQVEAFMIMERTRSNVEELYVPHEMSEVSDYITVSIGVASIWPGADTVSSDLIRQADAALYQAKKLGRNRVCRELA
ncbi:MAG: response regulator with diguanylate cyclase domain [Firmicutes bacterium]|nr:response regulator with diguanylate cyclase domain [Bacillota bacterium]